MTHELSSLLATAAARLAEAGVASPRHDAETLAAHLLGISRGAVHGVGRISDAEQLAFDVLIERRAAREPLQHITGRAAFRYLDLEVGPGVFVPRPETEVMAGLAVDELRRLAAAGCEPIAVDLCTGSGAVALAMGTEVPQASVVGVELSATAAAYAERNSRGTSVEIRIEDLADVPRSLAHLLGTVHVVTANPPYIPLTAWDSVEQEVRAHDPGLALWSGDDGLDAIRQVAVVAAALAADNGWVACEHADVQGEAAPEVFATTGLWHEVRDHTDLAGRPRFVTARRVSRSQTRPGTISP